jgi:hypothetical protein
VVVRLIDDVSAICGCGVAGEVLVFGSSPVVCIILSTEPLSTKSLAQHGFSQRGLTLSTQLKMNRIYREKLSER